MTAYTAYDMLRYNRQRKAEFTEVQKKLSVDSLEAARLAYMRGDATAEQVALVDKANEDGGGFQLPSILSAPKPIGSRAIGDRGDVEAGMPTTSAPAAPPAANNSSRLWGLLSFRSKESERQDSAAQQAATEQQPKSLDEKRAMLESARAAFEKEKENQRVGGPLDRIGTEEADPSSASPKDAAQPKKKGWLW